MGLSGPAVLPQQRVLIYSSEEWERFIEEWATGLGDDYVQVMRSGGAGDRGVDVAAFKSEQGFAGPWDCYQGKHYSKPLSLADALPEILKLLIHVCRGDYGLPDKYRFLAPQGCSTSLNQKLSNPNNLRESLLERLVEGDVLIGKFDWDEIEEVRELAQSVDFSIFGSVTILEAIEVHRSTPWHISRFGSPLPSRPALGEIPDDVAPTETRYVRQLLDAYAEACPEDSFDPDIAPRHPRFGTHFTRQRFTFYSAEALRLYARDSVPEGTFEQLQEDIFEGVIDIVEMTHDSALDRLAQALTASTQIDLSRHRLVTVSSSADRKGICHQLANVDRLFWSADP